MQIKELPTVPGEAIFGHARFLRNDSISFLQELSLREEPLLRFQVFHVPIIFVNSTELIRELLVDNARSVEKSYGMRASLYPLAGNGLFTSEQAIWRPQRKLMAPLFQPSHLSDYVSTMYQCAKRVADHLPNGQTVNIAGEMTRATMNIAGQTLFGSDTFDESDEIGKALGVCLRRIAENISSPKFILQATLLLLWRDHKAGSEELQKKVSEFLWDPPSWPNEKNREHQEALHLLNQKAHQMIEARRKEGSDRKDLLTRLLHAQDADTGKMSDKQVRDETMTLFLAGHETTANALSWCWHLLMQHPEAYRKLQREADALGDKEITPEDLDKLPYTLQVFKEALRLYPPVPAFDRQTQEEVQLGPLTLPKDTVTFISPYAIHHRPSRYPEPEKFLPERFTPENEEKRDRYSFLPFGGGPRTCIGNFFAMMEAQIVLAELARRFTFESVPSHPVEMSRTGVLKPKDGVFVKVKARSNAS